MLSNHLTFFLRSYSLLVILSLFLFSCAKDEVIKKQCRETIPASPDESALLISAKYQLRSLSQCVVNYIKFENAKDFELSSCQLIEVYKSGKVRKARVYGMNKNVPKALSMCFTQELFKLNFNNLQLNSRYKINFPMHFKTK